MGEAASQLLMPLGRAEAMHWCRDLRGVARAHGWHQNDALFLQFGRFCVYVRGPEHRKLLHPVVLAPKQDFLSLVPIVCAAGHFTYVDAQAVTDDVACDAHVLRLIGGIYRFANSCEQMRTRALPPGPLPDVGLDEAAAAALEERIAAKVRRLQDLADSTTRMLSAVFNGVSPQIVMDGPLAKIGSAVEDLVGSRLADTALSGMHGEAGAALDGIPQASPAPGADSPARPAEEDPLRHIWNDVATLRDLVQSRLAVSEKQRRLSATAEALQTRIIQVVEAALPSTVEGPSAAENGRLDEFSDAVVARVNFGRLREAVADIRAALTGVLDPDRLLSEAEASVQALAEHLGDARARELYEQGAGTVRCERAIDRTVDGILESATDKSAVEALLHILEEEVVRLVGAEESERLLSPLRAAVADLGEGSDRQALRDQGIGLLLALSSRGERRLESLFTAEELSEEDAWRLQGLHRALVGVDIARQIEAILNRLDGCLATESVPAEALLADKQALWGLAYEVLSWAETRKVAAAVAANTQPLPTARGVFSDLILASGEPLRDVVGRTTGLTEAIEDAVPIVQETPVLLSADGELLIPERTHRVIGGVTDVGTFRLSRQVARWNIRDAAELMACADAPLWVVFGSALGASYPPPAATTELLECAEAVAAAGSTALVWPGVVSHPCGQEGHASVQAFRPDPGRTDEIRAALHDCDGILTEFETALDARLEEVEAQLRATGYVPARMVAGYRSAATSLKDLVRSFGQEHVPTLASESWMIRASGEIDAFCRFAMSALQDAQRQGARARQNGTRALIAALYEIDDRRVLLRHLLRGLVSDASCEERLMTTGLLTPVAIELQFDAGQHADTLPVDPEALSAARIAAFVAAHAGPDADEEPHRRIGVLCELAASLFQSTEEPGPASALLLDFLQPVVEPLLARERSRPLLSPDVFDAFVAALRGHSAEVVCYLARRPDDARTADAAMLALVVRGMEGRRASRAPLWDALLPALRNGGALCGQPVAQLIHLSEPSEAARVFERLRSGDLSTDSRLVARVYDDAAKEAGVDLSSASADDLDLVRDDLLALTYRNLTRMCERILPERDLCLRLAAGTLPEEEVQALLTPPAGSGGGAARRPRRSKRAADQGNTPENLAPDLESLRARLSESARRYADYEHLATALIPYAEDTTGPLYPAVLAAAAGRPAEIVRPPLNGIPVLSQAAAPTEAPADTPAVVESAPPAAEKAAVAQTPVPAVDGPVDHFLQEFGHLGCDALAADLVEATLVLFPTDEHVRQTLSRNRKQVLDAILAREFPEVLKSTRMQIVVATEPRGLRLHDISDLLKMVSQGAATPAEVRNLLQSI